MAGRDDTSGARREAAVMNYHTWAAARFGADRSLIGSTVNN